MRTDRDGPAVDRAQLLGEVVARLEAERYSSDPHRLLHDERPPTAISREQGEENMRRLLEAIDEGKEAP